MTVSLLFILGLCLGSFVNALVWRLHTKKDWVKGRSECVHCHHELDWYDLIPVVSWLILKGRCQYCDKAISLQYPLVEVTTAVLFVLSYLYWPSAFNSALSIVNFGFWLLFLVGFMAMIVTDIRWMLLPNKLTYSFGLLAASQVLMVAIVLKDLGALLSAFGGVLAVGGLFYVLFQFSGGKWIGGGDVKLGLVLGLLAGSFIKGLMLVFLASLLGCFIAIPLIVSNKVNISKRIPFGPFLIASCILVVLFGQRLVDWYVSLLTI